MPSARQPLSTNAGRPRVPCTHARLSRKSVSIDQPRVPGNGRRNPRSRMALPPLPTRSASTSSWRPSVTSALNLVIHGSGDDSKPKCTAGTSCRGPRRRPRCWSKPRLAHRLVWRPARNQIPGCSLRSTTWLACWSSRLSARVRISCTPRCASNSYSSSSAPPSASVRPPSRRLRLMSVLSTPACGTKPLSFTKPGVLASSCNSFHHSSLMLVNLPSA